MLINSCKSFNYNDFIEKQRCIQEYENEEKLALFIPMENYSNNMNIERNEFKAKLSPKVLNLVLSFYEYDSDVHSSLCLGSKCSYHLVLQEIIRHLSINSNIELRDVIMYVNLDIDDTRVLNYLILTNTRVFIQNNDVISELELRDMKINKSINNNAELELSKNGIVTTVRFQQSKYRQAETVQDILKELVDLNADSRTISQISPIAEYSYETRKSYLKLLAYTISCDERIFAVEVNELYSLVIQLHLKDKDFLEIIDFINPFDSIKVAELKKENKEVIIQSRVKYYFILDAFRLAYIDNHFDAREARFLHTLGETFSISEAITSFLIYAHSCMHPLDTIGLANEITQIKSENEFQILSNSIKTLILSDFENLDKTGV